MSSRYALHLANDSRLSSAVGRVSVWAQKERNVKMRFALLHLERNLHERVQWRDFLQFEITASFKPQTINSCGEILAFREQLRTAAILMGSRRGQQSAISRTGW